MDESDEERHLIEDQENGDEDVLGVADVVNEMGRYCFALITRTCTR